MKAVFNLYPSPNGDSVCINPEDGQFNECYLDQLPSELKRRTGAATEPPSHLLPDDCVRFDACQVVYDYHLEKWSGL